jgi:hypothetical protein
MARTVPQTFEGDLRIDPEIVAVMQHSYVMALGDSDDASDALDTCYYDGKADALAWVLKMVHGMCEWQGK